MNETPEIGHTPLPWRTSLRLHDESATSIHEDNGRKDVSAIAVCVQMGTRDTPEAEANAAFIVRACNSHYQLVEALRASIDAIEDDRGLDDYICCSGYMCGCQGSSKRQLMLHDLRAALSQAGGASE